MDGYGLGDGTIVYELAVAAALKQAGVGEDFEVVRNGGRGDAAHAHDFAAVHLFSGGDGLKNPKTSLVGQGFRNLFDAGAVHGSIQSSEVSRGRIVPEKGRYLSPKKRATTYLDVHLSIEDSEKSETQFPLASG